MLSYRIREFFQNITGYYFYKIKFLPIGTDVFIDIKNRIKYFPLKTIFDVGANVGQSAITFSLANRNSEIYSFEPIENTFQQLKANTAKYTNIRPYKIAFGDKKGQSEIALAELSVFNTLRPEVMNKSIDGAKENIEISTIDKFCQENHIQKIDFLKIDTIGYELTVLKGALQMLNNNSISFVYADSTLQRKDVFNSKFYGLDDFLYQNNFLFYGLYKQNTQQLLNEISFAKALWIHRSIVR